MHNKERTKKERRYSLFWRLSIFVFFVAVLVSLVIHLLEEHAPEATVASLRLYRSHTPTKNDLKVVSYNIFNIPYFPDHVAQLERTCLIPQSRIAPDADVVVIEEMFRSGCHSTMPFERLMASHGWTHSTSVQGKGLSVSLINGGVQIYSRWPILAESEINFKSSFAWRSADLWCNKGIKYAQIDKNGRKFHILGTHMQSLEGLTYHQVRVEQARRIALYMNTMSIPKDEPVIIAGDFNTDMAHEQTRSEEIFSHMQVTMCPISGPVQFTYNRLVNNIVITQETPSWLDYIVYSKQHKQPKKCQFWAEMMTTEPYVFCRKPLLFLPYWVHPQSRFCAQSAESVHLSDHFPVIAQFEF
ncbi:hypothetical protein Ciccas_003806 [Cichlidogyrus casuarinus]|uniref:sphingomyelin phosphodiesterase n=1 Tax=Cichlidogyrus casuarinus TaxID=1844966 RepID=A0ABD2QFL1_9PLAT